VSAGDVVTARQRTAWWPWALLGLFCTTAVAATLLVAVNGESVAEQIPFVIAFSVWGAVGALLLSRAPGNRIGVLLLYAACLTAGSFLAGELTTYLVDRGQVDGPVVVVAALVSNVGWVLGILPVLFFLPLLFPDGHLPSRRWLPLAWAIAIFMAFLAVSSVIGMDVLTGSTEEIEVANPLYVPLFGGFEIPDAVFNFLLLALLVGSLASIVVRFRRSTGIERQQIKWVALAVLMVVVSFVVSSVLQALGIDSSLVDTLVSAPAFLALPVAIAVSVLQYRLYELDVVVKKALVAGTLAVFAIAVYAGVVGLLGVVTAEGQSAGAVFTVALLLGVAFRPVTRLARRFADRLVYGRRATPYEVLTEFSERVGDAYATEDVLGRMARILGEGVGARRARVWLRVDRELLPASVWPSDAPPRLPVRVVGERLPEIEGETAVEVRDKGELLGAFSVATPPNDPMTMARGRLVRDLASQAGLVLRNVRLVEELRAGQRRIVAAQDEARRRLERNIHDGAQQQLVALSVKLRLAESLVAKDPAKAEAMLADIGKETQSALEDLRDLARGIYPPLLADKGLAAALEAQMRRSLVPVELDTDGIGRYPQEVEAALYFTVLETLQNVAKYAEASSARIELAELDGELAFLISDDGRGFDPAATAHGTGLQGIADRLAALDGAVEIDSRPGGGTTVSGRIPVRRRREPLPAQAPDPVPSVVGGRT
jgi:signal transduction histidine kinase